jgi:hypothetical protein
MTQLQAVRGKLETITRDALHAGGIAHVVFDNTLETTPRVPYAIVTLSFGPMIATSMGCGADHVRGSMIVNIFTGKAQGSIQGEDAALEVLRAWVKLNRDFAEPLRLRTRNQEGPVTVDASGAPVHIHTLNAGFVASARG